MPDKPQRNLNIVDLVIVLLIGGGTWYGLYQAPVKLSTTEYGLAVPVCMTLGFAGIALHSLLLGRAVSIQPIAKIAYTVAWTCSAGRYLILTGGFGLLPPDSIAAIAIAGSGLFISLASAVTAVLAARQSFSLKRTAAGLVVVFFGTYPAVWVLFDALSLLFGPPPA